jgi:hypothetical protein
MDWWVKLKEMIIGRDSASSGRASDRSDRRLPSFIMALCSVSDESAFSVEITSLSVGGLKVQAPRRLRTHGNVQLRVPVGLNFEERDTNEYVTFNARVVWTQRRSGGFESGMRYLEEENPMRDRWIQLVLQTYGVSLGDDRRRGDMTRYSVHLPVALGRSGSDPARGEVRNISLGGVQIAVDGTRLRSGEVVEVSLQPESHPPLQLGATVMHGHSDSEGSTYTYGLAFDELSPAQRDTLVAMVSELSRVAVAARAAEPETEVSEDEEEEPA